MTPVPFWLMIASMAMAVLPVSRSPMISSRWPRPIGIMASMALMPVCSGSVDRLAVGDARGAGISIGMSLTLSIGPLPSMGWPSGLTTRPSRPSPTGTESTRPVRLTVVALVDVEVVAEDDDTDRVLFEVEGQADGRRSANSTISPAITFRRP